MSILLKALKQAESDRAAALPARRITMAEGSPGTADGGVACVENPADDTAPIRRPADDSARNVYAMVMNAYGGLCITLALAMISATAFGYWMRELSAVRSQLAQARSVQAPGTPPDSMALPGTTPAALRAHETRPLKLRLDRHLNTLTVHKP